MLVFISFTFTCGFIEPENNSDEIIYTDVVYSEDGKSVTIYLDEQVPVSSSDYRALSKSQAILGHDFFEVVFIYQPATGSPVIARGSWELGETTGVTGIYRSEAGSNYGAAISRTPGANSGTAIIFAGKKTDKTLLAVGALSAVDGNTSSRSITTATKAVSFEINALKAGAVNEMNNPNIPQENSSFYTNAASPGNDANRNRTWFADLNISFRKYPVFGVPRGSSTLRAAYNIGTHSSSHPFSEYNPGIILATAASSAPNYEYTYNGSTYKKVESVQPHFTLPDETVWNTAGSTNPYSTATVVGLANNNSAIGDLFANPIQFTLNTSNVAVVDGQILSITFQIPVYAISQNNDISGNAPVMWFIRPGYDKYREELDDGRFGNGGAVLISIGQMQSTPLYSLRVTDVPLKYNYNGVVSGGYSFNLDGSTIQFFQGGNPLYTSTAGANPGGSLKYYIDWNNNYNTLGAPDVGPGPWPPYTSDQQIYYTPTPHVFPSNINRVLTIIVEYRDPDFSSHDPNTEYYYTTFQINVNTLNVDISNIPIENRFLVGRENDLGVANGLYAAVNNRGGVFMVVLTQSFDIATHTFPVNKDDVTIIVTATKPNITIGRLGAGGTGATWTFQPGTYTATVFFGTWPFNEPIMVGGQVLEDHPFRFNTTGSYADFNAASNSITNVFINQGTAGTLNVFRGSEVTQKGTLFSVMTP